ncbi:MAG: cupredoxin domain-containing protein [Dehalococcoidia bacterium]|nr:cupredoxin domain-containing protein [Dehalococcoidia bacterium]
MAALVVSACGGGGAPPEPDAPLGEPSVRLDVTMRDIAFEPATLEGRAREVIEIALKNTGSLAHDFTVKEIAAEVAVTQPASRARNTDTGIHVHLDGRTESVMQLRVATPGTYEFYCSVSGHRPAGMAGTLVVTD